MPITRRRVASQEVSKAQMLFWLGVLINQAEQERNRGSVRYAPEFSFKTDKVREREALDIERLRAEAERIRAEANRTNAEAAKVRADTGIAIAEERRTRAEEARARAEEARALAEEAKARAEAEVLLSDKQEKKRKSKIEVGSFLVSVLSVIISFYAGIIAPPSAHANRYLNPPAIYEPLHKPGWLERLLKFIAPVVLNVELRLVQAENALNAGADPNLVRNALVADLELMRQEAAAAASRVTFRDKLSREMEAQRLTAMIDIFNYNVSEGFTLTT